MKSSRLILAGIGFALIQCQPAVAATPAANAEFWLNHYYQQPQPELFVANVCELSRSGFFERAGNVPLAIGFMGSVFAQNPEQVDFWVVALSGLPRSHQRLVAAALWYSGSRRGVEYLQAYARVVGPEMRAEIERLITLKPDLGDAEVRSTSSLNLQWGAFLATGEAQHIIRVLAALGSDQPGLGAAVRTALAEKAMTHERVYEICQAELARQTTEVSDQVRTALAAAGNRP